MKQAFRTSAWTLGAATLVAGLAGQASAAERREAGQPVAVAPVAGELTAIDRLAATRAEFRGILVDSGLPSVEVTAIVDHLDALTGHFSRLALENPDELGGRSVQDIVAAKAPGFLAEHGVSSITITHLSALAEVWATERIAVDVEMSARVVAAPAVEGSLR